MAKRINNAAAAAPAAAPTPAVADAPIVPSDADVEAVVAASEALDTPADADEAKAREHADAGKVFDEAAVVNNDVPVVLDAGEVIHPADVARLEAQALADAENAREPEAEERKEIEFPCSVRVLNNGRVSLTEKVSGAFLAAGGSATICLPDAETAKAVAESLQQLAEENYLAPGALVAQPA
jgi:hypothetical protein